MTSDNADLVSKLDTLLAARLQPFGDRLSALETTDAAPRDAATPSRQQLADPDQAASQSAPSPLVRRRPWLFGAEASTAPLVAGSSLPSPSVPQQQQQQKGEEAEARRHGGSPSDSSAAFSGEAPGVAPQRHSPSTRQSHNLQRMRLDSTRFDGCRRQRRQQRRRRQG